MATSKIYYLDLQNDYWKDRNKPGMVVKACHPGDWKSEKEDWEFRTSQGSIVRYYVRKYQNKAGQKFYHTLFYTPTAHRKIIHKLDIVHTISRKI